MRPSPSIGLTLRTVSLFALGACSSSTDCVNVPCALSRALAITVSNATSGGTVSTAVFTVQGQMAGSGQCGGTPTVCSIFGTAGTYSVTISAPGFQSTTRTVTVSGTEGEECHCGTANTEHLDVALVAD